MGPKGRWVRHPGWLVFFLVVFVLMPLQPNSRQAYATDQKTLTSQIDEPVAVHAGYLNGSPQLFVTRGDCSSGGQLYAVSHTGVTTLLMIFEPRTATPSCTKFDVVVLPTGPKVPTSTVAVQLGRETFVLSPAPFPSTVFASQAPTFSVSPSQCTSANWTVTVDPLGAQSARFPGLIVSCGDGTTLEIYEWKAGPPATTSQVALLSNVSVQGRPGVLHPNWDGCGGCLGAYDDVQRKLLVISYSGLIQQWPLTSCIPTNSGRGWVFSTLRFFAFTDLALDPFDPNGQGVMASIPSRDDVVAFKVSTFSPYDGQAIVGTFSGPIVAVSHQAGHACTQVHAGLGGNRSLEDGTPGPHRVIDVTYSQEAANINNKGPLGNIVATILSTNEFHPADLYAAGQFSILGFGKHGTEISFVRAKSVPDANGDGWDELKAWFDARAAGCSNAVPCLLTSTIGDPDVGFGE